MRKWIMVALWGLLVVPVHAQVTAEAQLTADLANAQTEKINATAALANLDKRLAELNVQADALKPKVEAWNAANARLKDEAAQYERAVSAHNARCAGSFTDEAYVRACNNRKADLDAWKAALNGRISSNNNAADALRKEQSAGSTGYMQIKESYNRNNEALRNAERKIAVISAKLQSLRKGTGQQACLGLPSTATDEEVKLKCGNVQFDGANPNLPPLSR